MKENILVVLFILIFCSGLLIVLVDIESTHDHPEDAILLPNKEKPYQIQWTEPGGFSGRRVYQNTWWYEIDDNCCRIAKPDYCFSCGKIWKVDTLTVCGSYKIKK